mmetsp:Transcript_8323/g.13960  ORF Transcript_8323/g.13960 Transcript_8323/m.13960 type:complete len:113 (-) Transcript_8323:313-651(-)|eukprot:CAMPEP_0119312494 /NCGR_PEP_ID=MMETSP1333-20130426/26659_1 /TAXON_ID=418940 /ORGANISM="Scyphosphaera apsteinii, Strain RCC1455" /LENGTH=112 /DNA_ID=CAMNT_0007317123 /DNA_START=72 /DNA_END=410 /DNA_ORIENTATION=+
MRPHLAKTVLGFLSNLLVIPGRRIRDREPERSCSGCFVQQVDGGKYVVFVRLNDATIHHHLVEDEVRLLKVEHDVQFTHVLEVTIQCLNEGMDELKHSKFILVFPLNSDDEK